MMHSRHLPEPCCLLLLLCVLSAPPRQHPSQGELLQQVAINRSRLGVVLQAALEDMPAQADRSAQYGAWEDEINAYHLVRRG